MDIKAKCVVCEKEFTAGSKKAMYCSNKCKKKMENNGYRLPKRKKGMSITEIAVAARDSGMSYGQYVAKMGL